TLTSTSTLTPTSTSTVPPGSTATFTPTVTNTPAVSNTPTATNTATATNIPATTNTPTTTPTITPVSVEPGTPTEVTTTDGSVNLTVPGDAFTQPVSVAIQTVVPGTPPAGAIGDVSALKAIQIIAKDEQGNDIHTLAHPLTIVVSFTAADAAGKNPALFK